MSMDRNDHLLFIVAEECAEVAQRASKCARFGMKEVQDGQSLNNTERLILEFNDLMAAMHMLLPEEMLLHGDKIASKKNKIEKYFQLSKEQGTLR